jgi:hypothetical protein
MTEVPAVIPVTSPLFELIVATAGVAEDQEPAGVGTLPCVQFELEPVSPKL